MNKIKDFKENGFYIEKSVIPISLQEELFLKSNALFTLCKLSFEFESYHEKKLNFSHHLLSQR